MISRTNAIAAALAAMLLASAAPTAGAPGGLPDGHAAWTYLGDALGVAPDGTAYLGTTSLVAVTASTPVVRLAGGGTDTAWPDVPGASAAGADGHGGYYAGGTAASGGTGRLQHVLPSHVVDPHFKASFDREPAAIVAAGGLVVVAGPFHTVDGQPRAGLAALDAATGALAAWNPSPDGPVHALADGGDGTVFVTGEFSHLAGVARNGLAQLGLPSGAATAWNPAPAVVTGAPLALAVTPRTVVLGGGFLWFQQRREVSRLAAIDRASGAVTPLGPVDGVGASALGGEVTGVAVLGGAVYAAGDWTTVGPEKRAGLAAFDLASGGLLPWAPADDGAATHVAVTPAGVLAAADHVRLLDAATGAALPFSPIGRGGPLVVLGDELLLVETDQQVGVGKAGGLAAIGPDGRPRPSFSPPAGLRYVRVLRAGAALFAFACPAHGCGNGAAGLSRAVLRLDPATGARASWRARAAWPARVPRRDGWTIGDAVADGRTLDVLILFLPPGSSQPAASAIESFDVASGRRLGTALQLPTGAPSIALALVRSGPWLVAGGLADDRGRALARLDPRSLRARGWTAAATVRAAGGQPAAIGQLAAAGGRVYLLGPFTVVGGASRSSRLAAVSAASGRVLPFAPRLRRNVFAEHVAACPGFVAVTGSGSNGNVDAILDPASGRPLRWTHPTMGGPIYAGPAGLLSVAGRGAALFPGALGSCAPS